MKNVFKVLLVTIFLVASGTSVFAQVSTNATVSATVLTSLTLAKSTDVSFGQVVIGVTPTMLNITGVKTDCGATATIGKFLATGTATAQFIGTWTTPIVLAAGPKNLDFNPTVSQADDNVATAFGGAAYTSGNALTLPASGNKTFWIGGTLTKTGGGNIAAGSEGVYSGTFTLTVQYN
jgi:hypothetical protein